MALGELLGQRKSQKQNPCPYESGMQALRPGTRRMPVRFYLIAGVVILFDIEFLLPPLGDWSFENSSKRTWVIHSRRDDRLYCYLYW